MLEVTCRLTVAEVSAMPQPERQRVISREEATRLGLVYVDGIGGVQFIGTPEESAARFQAMRGMEPRVGSSARRTW